MEVEIGRGKKARRAYGFDDIAIVPSRRTRDPEDVDISWKLGAVHASSCRCSPRRWTASSTPPSAIDHGQARRPRRCSTSRALQTRYEDADDAARRASPRCPRSTATRAMQEIYQEPIKPELIAQRIKEIKDGGVLAAASLTPQRVEQYIEIALDAGLDILVIQGTVVSAEHVSKTRSSRSTSRSSSREPESPSSSAAVASYHDRAAPHAHRRRRRARRRRPGPRLHHPRRARHRRAAGHRHRRRRGAPASGTSRDRRVRATSSPTAACAPAATSPRRSPAAPTP